MTEDEKNHAAILRFAEAQGQRAHAFAGANLDLARQRAHALLVLLLGGGGAMGALALSQAQAALWLASVAGAVALWWFALAAYLAWRALPSQGVTGPACDGWVLVQHAQALGKYVKEVEAEGKGEVVADVLTLLREGELRSDQKSADACRDASTRTALAVDAAYRLAACTPLVAALVWLVLWLVGRG